MGPGLGISLHLCSSGCCGGARGSAVPLAAASSPGWQDEEGDDVTHTVLHQYPAGKLVSQCMWNPPRRGTTGSPHALGKGSPTSARPGIPHPIGLREGRGPSAKGKVKVQVSEQVRLECLSVEPPL